MTVGPSYRLLAAIKNSSDDDFLVVRQDRPPPLPEDEHEYSRFVDSDLWDLPSALLKPSSQTSELVIRGADSVSGKLDLGALNVGAGLNQVVSQLGAGAASIGDWAILKYAEEPDFGPGLPVHMLFVVGIMETKVENLGDSCKWMSKETALNLLLKVNKNCERVGPSVVIGLLHDLTDSENWKTSLTSPYQEYPPGVTLFPMKSLTGAPFRTTNLVVMAPNNDGVNKCEEPDCIAYGDALLMDPGCSTLSHSELADLVAALPRKLCIFVTHHHYDHVDGLSVVQKCNPHSTLLAHENTMNRIGKAAWSLGYTSISGSEKICIGGQILEAVYAPGHTDGHLALLHVSTNSLIVGDHCVGHGSAVLDVRAGGNMKDYLLTTYKFLELSPHVLIPMHGRINLWPKRMLCGYLKNRRARELSILKAIECGAQTLFEITAKVYADYDTNLWLPASMNVQIHVEHLAHQEKLPKDFSMKRFQATCHLHFICRWIWTFLKGRNDISMKIFQATSHLQFLRRGTWRFLKVHRGSAVKVLAVLGVVVLALFHAVKLKYQ